MFIVSKDENSIINTEQAATIFLDEDNCIIKAYYAQDLDAAFNYENFVFWICSFI